MNMWTGQPGKPGDVEAKGLFPPPPNGGSISGQPRDSTALQDRLLLGRMGMGLAEEPSSKDGEKFQRGSAEDETDSLHQDCYSASKYGNDRFGTSYNAPKMAPALPFGRLTFSRESQRAAGC